VAAINIPEAFRTAWVVDTEFIPDGPTCHPVCLVGYELRSGRTIHLWQDQLGKNPPYSVGSDSLFIAYNVQAELGFHRALGWPMPERILDLYFEFRHRTSGVWPPRAHRKLVNALRFFGLNELDAEEKQEMIDRILQGPPWNETEPMGILKYCERDVLAERRLFYAMAPEIRWPYAIYRGRYAQALAHTATSGTWLDVPLWRRLDASWEAIQDRLIARINPQYRIYEGRTFKTGNFIRYLVAQNIAWPLLDTGRLNLEEVTFRDMAVIHPQLLPLHQLRQALSDMRLHKLAIGKDGVNRCFLNPFGSSTGRNQPRNNEYLWGMPKWLRGLGKPPEGWGMAYLDYGGQEFGEAAGLSRDPNMMEAYRCQEAYLWFAKRGKLVPENATKKTHPRERSLYKTSALAIQYGIGPESLGRYIGRPSLFAGHLINLHHDLFSQYWRWSDRMINHAVLTGRQSTVFDWIHRLPPEPSPTVLRNFPIQSNGAEMMRLAHCLATERGINVAATIHDAFLITSPLEHLEADITLMSQCMIEASRIILKGFELFVGVEPIKYPDRYRCPEGEAMWELVMQLLEEVETVARNLQPIPA
jgi:hypothetical protein